MLATQFFAHRSISALAASLVIASICTGAAVADEIKIAAVKQSEPVDFGKQILPILRSKCLSCHNATEAEGDLVMETPAGIAKGGAEGAGLVAGKGLESLVIKMSAHQVEPVMPPEDNDVAAKNMTPEELGLFQLWIDQGAKGGSGTGIGPIKWQPLPAGVNPIYATAITPDGQYAAAGRANQVFIFHVPSKREIGRLTDPQLAKQLQQDSGVSHLDLIQSLAFSPSGELLASGGYRTAKLWRRPTNVKLAEMKGVAAPVSALAVSADAAWIAVGEESGVIRVYAVSKNEPAKSFQGHGGAVTGLAFSADGTRLVSSSKDKTARVWSLADGKEQKKLETPAEAKSAAWVDDAHVAIGGADKIIRIVAIADGKSARELKGHTQSVDSLVSFGDQQLLSGGPDGNLKHWNAKDGKLVRTMNHAGPLSSIAVNPDATRFASCSTNKTAKIWDASNGRQLFELKGDHQLAASEADVTRALALAKTRVDLANADLKAAQARKKAEEDNKTKADEAAKKAVEDHKKKVEAAKKPVADKAVADKKLVETTAVAKTADETKKAKDSVVESHKNELKSEQAKQTATVAAVTKSAAALKVAQTASGTATAAATKSTQAVATAQKAVDADTASSVKTQAAAKTALASSDQAAKAAAAKADDKGLAATAKTAKDASDKAAVAAKAAADKLNKSKTALTAAQTAKKAADANAAKAKTVETTALAEKTKTDVAKTATDKLVAAVQAKLTASTAEQKTATTALTAATAAQKAADAEVKKQTPIEKKASDELTAAERALAAAKRSATRAIQSVKKATDDIPPIEAIIKTRTGLHKTAEGVLAAAKKLNVDSQKPVQTVAFSDDGATLATSGDDQRVHLWDAATGTPMGLLAGHAQAIRQVAFLKGKELVSAGGTAVVRWNAQPAWVLERVIGDVADDSKLQDRVTALAFSHDGTVLATGSGEPSRSGEVKLWNTSDGALLRALKEPHTDTVLGLEFAREDDFIATCAADRFVKVFNVNDGSFVRSFEGHTHHVLGVSWSADSRTLASAGADKVVKIWDFRTGDQKRTITGFGKEVTSIQFVADGNNIIASCGDARVHVKRADNGGNVRTLAGASDFMYAADATADGKIFIAGGQDSVVRIWSDAGQIVATFEPPKTEEPKKDGE